MKSGFSLIEVIIATMLASMLSITLFLSWNQVQRVVSRADDSMGIFDRFMTIQRQFEHDFTGMCLPISRPYIKQEEKEEAAKPAPTVTLEAPKEAQKKEKPKQVERVFYAKNKGDLFESLTCLTNNPMQIYWSDRAGSARPRIARIQYRLEQDPKTEKKPSYTLYRQEAHTLDDDRFGKEHAKAVRSYAVANNIKELKLIYWQEIEKEKEPKEGDKEKNTEKKAKEIKKIVEWDLEKEQPQKNIYIRPIPTMISVTLSIWDAQKKKSRTFTFMIPIDVVIENPKEKKTYRRLHHRKRQHSQQLLRLSLH